MSKLWDWFKVASRKARREMTSKAGWTLIQGVASLLIVHGAGIHVAWAPAIMAGLSLLKSFAATKAGDPSSTTFTASTAALEELAASYPLAGSDADTIPPVNVAVGDPQLATDPPTKEPSP